MARLLKIIPNKQTKFFKAEDNFKNGIEQMIKYVAHEIFESGANVDEVINAKWVYEESFLDESDLEEITENYSEMGWVIPDLNDLNFTSTKWINSYDFIVSLNNFNSLGKVIWMFQYLKTETDEIKNQWAQKIADLVDNYKNQDYSKFWKVVLWNTESSNLPSLNFPALGGLGPSDAEIQAFMNNSWKFRNKEAIKLAFIYTIKHFAQEKTDDNIYWDKIWKTRIIQRPKIKTRLVPIFTTNLNLLDDLKVELENLKRQELEKME